MRKIVFILSLLILLGSCATSKRSLSSSDVAKATTAGLNKGVAEDNLTKNSFFIERADIEYNNQGDIQNFLATVKFEYPGKYLISIRSKAGFEAARIYITKDTILINDRLNQIMYYGGVNILSVKYGLEYSMMPVFFGDIVLQENDLNRSFNCEGNIRNVSINVRGKKVIYTLDCKTNKLINVSIQGDKPGSEIVMDYAKYVKSDFGVHPSVINFKYPGKTTSVRMRIRKIQYNYEGKIEFIPGARYERRELL